MRVLLMLGMLCGVAGPAFAQQPASSASASKECWPVTTSQVIVRTDAGMRKGTLLCIGPDAVVLAGSDPLPLSTVLEITRPRDGVLDGALKGAAVGLVVVALCAGECEAEYAGIE